MVDDNCRKTAGSVGPHALLAREKQRQWRLVRDASAQTPALEPHGKSHTYLTAKRHRAGTSEGTRSERAAAKTASRKL